MKLEDIPKKQNFTIPQGYFDTLPGRIQARVSVLQERQPALFYRLKLQYALPGVAICSIIMFLLLPAKSDNVDRMLATVETADLIAYLDDSDLTTEELLDEVNFNADDVEEIEMEIYQLNLDDNTFDALIEETQSDTL